jgi:ubiquinone/menaquinone biosynthesis C-methylase UbiE
MSEVRAFLCNLYWRLEDIIDPGVRNSQWTYAERVTSWIDSESIWLEMGCGHSIFAPWMPSAEKLANTCKCLVGIDYDLESLQKHNLIRNRIRADLQNIPCADGSFNRITANMVMEHVRDPDQALKAVARLLQPGGVFIFHTPNYRHYWTFLSSIVPQKVKNKVIELAEGRAEEDVFPTFYRINTAASIRRAAKHAGLEIREFHKLHCSSTTAIFALGPFVVLDLLLRRLTRWRRLENFRENFVVVLQKPGDEK